MRWKRGLGAEEEGQGIEESSLSRDSAREEFEE
jgi:hypothetical protein